jgi:hypothetical protein
VIFFPLARRILLESGQLWRDSGSFQRKRRSFFVHSSHCAKHYEREGYQQSRMPVKTTIRFKSRKEAAILSSFCRLPMREAQRKFIRTPLLAS